MATTKQNIKFSFGNWQKLPYHVFDDIMIMMGRESLNDLQKCRKVCKSWNVMMSQMTKYEKDSIRRKAESLAKQIRKEWEVLEQRRDEWSDFEMIKEEWEEIGPYPCFPEIITTASLAHHGMLGSVDGSWLDLGCCLVDLQKVDPASSPSEHEHLASLVSCVTDTVSIVDVSNCDLVKIMDSVKSENLFISDQRLSSEETRALVRAMETRVESLELGDYEEMSLDITALTQYSGQGKCRRVMCWYDTADRYKKEMRSWARRINWTVLFNLDEYIVIKRKQL